MQTITETRMKAGAIAGPWSTTERILVCVSPSPSSPQLVRAAKRRALRGGPSPGAPLPHHAPLATLSRGGNSHPAGEGAPTGAGEGARRPYLDGRIVFCANCEDKRPLALSPVGLMVCSACSSPYWAYIERTCPAPNAAGQEMVEIAQLERMFELPPSPGFALDPLPQSGRGDERSAVRETRDEYVARITRQAVERLNRAQERAEEM